MVSWDAITLYAGFGIALLLYYGMGRVFFIPMVLNFVFDVCLRAGFFGGWDIRLVMVGYGGAFFVWVLALAGMPNKITFVALALAEFGSIFHGLLPQLTAVGSGGEFWNTTSTAIVDVWMTSIFVVSVSVVLRGTVVSVFENGYMELLTVPKQRFLVPIAMWSGVIVIPDYIHGVVPPWLHANRFLIASELLAWGWVAFELPFFIMYRRLGRVEKS